MSIKDLYAEKVLTKTIGSYHIVVTRQVSEQGKIFFKVFNDKKVGIASSDAGEVIAYLVGVIEAQDILLGTSKSQNQNFSDPLTDQHSNKDDRSTVEL